MITPVGKRSCENCGNASCAMSVVAFWYDDCIKSDYTRHWIPKGPKERMEYMLQNCSCETNLCDSIDKEATHD